MNKQEHLLAEKLLRINAIKLQPESPFVWSSGWNSPIYCDNRVTLSYPDVRNFIKIELCCYLPLLVARLADFLQSTFFGIKSENLSSI